MSTQVEFKPRKQRNFRKKPASEDAEDALTTAGGEQGGDEPEVQRDKLEQMRLLHRMRRRAGGTSSEALAATAAAEVSGGLSEEPESETGDAAVMGGFSKETKVVTNAEDENMAKFVEQELAKRLGKRVGDATDEDPEAKRKRLEAELYKIPEEYKTELVTDSVIPGMNTIISEVQISMTDKLKNIEAVEMMKNRMLGSNEDYNRRKADDGHKRKEFAMTFGKQKKVELSREEKEEVYKKMKVISDRGAGGRPGSKR